MGNNHGLLNIIGGGEKPIINIPPYDKLSVIPIEDLAAIQERDFNELKELEKQGITITDLAVFMDYLITGAFHHEVTVFEQAKKLRKGAWKRLSLSEKVSRYLQEAKHFKFQSVKEEDYSATELLQFDELHALLRRNIVGGLFRVDMLRGADFNSRWDGFVCPYPGCEYAFSSRRQVYNRDVYFSPTVIFENYYDGGNFSHPPLRINDISAHLVAAHSLFEKGTGDHDQDYPTSPLEFAKDFYVPWRKSLEQRH